MTQYDMLLQAYRNLLIYCSNCVAEIDRMRRDRTYVPTDADMRIMDRFLDLSHGIITDLCGEERN